MEPTVISPVPYAPPLLPVEAFAKFRRVIPYRRDAGWDVFHPRVPIPPGYVLQRYEPALAWPILRRLADRLHASIGFDLLHAHFMYPDGVVAARLACRLGVPLVVSEHASWKRTFAVHRAVRAQVLEALPHVRLLLPVSASLQRDMEEAVDTPIPTTVLPNVVDEITFRPSPVGGDWDSDQLLFVGLIREVKGLDVLVRALPALVARRPAIRLRVIGAAFYRSYHRDEEQVRHLAADLGVADRIHFAGEATPEAVAAEMRRSAVLVVPSRRESFSSVTAEAIACGTPVVATRCGGPEEILTPATGRLARVEDSADLASAIEHVLEHRRHYDARQLHEHIVARFGTASIGRRLEAIYSAALNGAESP